MLKFKLSRVGKKKQPSYRVILTERGRDPWGKVLETVGFYNPLPTPPVANLKIERIKYWMSKGAQPTDSLYNIFVSQGIIEGKKKNVSKLTKRIVAARKKEKEKEAEDKKKTTAEKKTATEAKPAQPAKPEEAKKEEKK